MTQAEAGRVCRPVSVSQAEYESRWDAIFRRDGLDDIVEKTVDTDQKNNYNNNTETQKD